MIRAAIIDMNNNTPNESMRCLKEMLGSRDVSLGLPLEYHVFDARHRNEIPGLGYDFYLSTGGPGSPLDGIDKAWEAKYFRFLDKVWNHNQSATQESRKHIFFICHSFQLMCRFFQLAEINERQSMSFGITEAHMTGAGTQEPCFEGLSDPFHVADFRSWQAVQPNGHKLAELGAAILSLEKPRPELALERAVTAIRISPEIIGTQFHPEADAYGMSMHFHKADKKKFIIEHHGELKYHKLLAGLSDRTQIDLTHRTVIPNFIRNAVKNIAGLSEMAA